MNIFTSIKRNLILYALISISCYLQLHGQNQNVNENNPRKHLLMDFGWKFAFGNSIDAEKVESLEFYSA